MIKIALGTTRYGAPDPPPVELAEDEALLVNAGAYRVVIKGDRTMHVIDDREGDTVFQWPLPTENAELEPVFAVQAFLDGDDDAQTQTGNFAAALDQAVAALKSGGLCIDYKITGP